MCVTVSLRVSVEPVMGEVDREMSLAEMTESNYVD